MMWDRSGSMLCERRKEMGANGMAWLKNEPDTFTGYLLDLKVPDRRMAKVTGKKRWRGR
jgi:hypothetical protein